MLKEPTEMSGLCRCFKEGGKGASIRKISPSDNRGAGSSIGHALSDIPDNAKIKFEIV